MSEKSTTKKKSDQIAELEARVDKLQTIVAEAFELLADETRPVFGWGPHVARYFEAIAKRIRKELFGDE